MPKHRNRFEDRIAATLDSAWQYEAVKLPYVIEHTYTPDFVNVAAKRIIETKGYLRPEDRAKLIAVKKANPDWSIAIVFQNPSLRISKTSRTTYGMWADRHGFEWRKG